MKTVGLFAGVGGIELGLRRAGHEVTLLCDIDPAARAVLRTRFPGVPLACDVTALRKLPVGVELVTAGFPCQDLSQAGKTRGIGGARSGLIDHVFALLEQQEVPWVLLENVSFMLSLQRGAAMKRVVQRLEAIGYAWAYRVVDSRAFGLPQRRKRVYLIASKDQDPATLLFNSAVEPAPLATGRDVAIGFYWTEGTRGLGWAIDALPTLKGGSALGIPSPPAAWLPSDEIVVPTIAAAERLQGFPSGWTKPAVESGKSSYRWTLVGNAVSVQASEWLGRCLRARPRQHPTRVFDLGENAQWPSAAFGYPIGERYGVNTTEWPVVCSRTPLVDVLGSDIEYLSSRATNGFLTRLQKSNLRRPAAFDKALKSHISRMATLSDRMIGQ